MTRRLIFRKLNHYYKVDVVIKALRVIKEIVLLRELQTSSLLLTFVTEKLLCLSLHLCPATLFGSFRCVYIYKYNVVNDLS